MGPSHFCGAVNPRDGLRQICVRFSVWRNGMNLHGVSKNDNDVAHYNFDVDQPILIIFGRDVAERVCYEMVICYPTSPN